MAEKPEDLNLPNSVIARIIKEALPEGVIISKETRSAISKAASVFVLYCTSCANNFALQQKRKTLKDADVLSALEEMEFEHFLPNLKESLDSFKKEKRNASEKKKKAKEISENASPKQDERKDDNRNELDKSDTKDIQENNDTITID